MGAMNSPADRLRRATALWHAYLAITGERFDLAQFLQDPVLEKHALDHAVASGDPKLIGLVQEWLLCTGQAPGPVTRVAPAAAPAAGGTPEQPKAARYLRGVR